MSGPESMTRFTLDDLRRLLDDARGPILLDVFGPRLPPSGRARRARQLRRLAAIIDSMTPAERRDPALIDESRRRRIAAGAGVEPRAVSDLIAQFDQMAGFLKGNAGRPEVDPAVTCRPITRPRRRVPREWEAVAERNLILWDFEAGS